MAWQKSTNENKVIGKIKRETEKAYLIIAKDAPNGPGFREYWVPKSQVLSEKADKKNDGCLVLGLSDWIFDKMEPSSPIEFQDFEGAVKGAPAPKPGGRQYVMRQPPKKSPKEVEEDGYLVPNDEDIPF
jgi:hypothetical protein